MVDDINKILDECIGRIKGGESMESCLLDYPDSSQQLKPLLLTALRSEKADTFGPGMETYREIQERFNGLGGNLWVAPLFLAISLGGGYVLWYWWLSVEKWFDYLVWGLMVLGIGFCAIFGTWSLARIMMDIRSGQTTLTGRVNRKWDTTASSQESRWKSFNIDVNGHVFDVSQRLFNWLSQDDELVVHYWPRTNKIAKVEKNISESP